MKHDKIKIVLSLIIGAIFGGILIGGITYYLMNEKLNNAPNTADKEENNNEASIYYEGIKEIKLIEYKEIGNTSVSEKNIKTIVGSKNIEKVVTLLDDKTESSPSGLGGINLPSVELVYDNKVVKIVFYATNLISVTENEQNKIYKVNYDGDVLEDIRSIFSTNATSNKTENDIPYYQGIKSISLVRVEDNTIQKTITDKQQMKEILAHLYWSWISEKQLGENIGCIATKRLELHYLDKTISVVLGDCGIYLGEDSNVPPTIYDLSTENRQQIMNFFN